MCHTHSWPQHWVPRKKSYHDNTLWNFTSHFPNSLFASGTFSFTNCSIYMTIDKHYWDCRRTGIGVQYITPITNPTMCKILLQPILDKMDNCSRLKNVWQTVMHDSDSGIGIDSGISHISAGIRIGIGINKINLGWNQWWELRGWKLDFGARRLFSAGFWLHESKI